MKHRGLSLAHICLDSSRPLTVGQLLRLTLFLPGEMEVAGTVGSRASAASAEKNYVAKVAFDTIDEQQATALEGIILAERMAHRSI